MYKATEENKLHVLLIYGKRIQNLIQNLYVFSLSFQVVYVTATFPYFVLVIFFFRGITLHGFEEGVKLLFIPDVSLICI